LAPEGVTAEAGKERRGGKGRGGACDRVEAGASGADEGLEHERARKGAKDAKGWRRVRVGA